MYHFYLNFPNYKTKNIKIHHQDCNDCNLGHGKQNSLSNINGFWAGPFNTIKDAEDSLNRLLNLVSNKFKFNICSRCKNKTNP